MPSLPLTDHAIHILYDFNWNGVAPDDLLHLSPDNLQHRLKLGLIHPERKRTSDIKSALFVRREIELARDLHPATITALLGQPTVCRTVSVVRLTDQGRAIVNGAWVRPPSDPRGSAVYSPRRGIAFDAGEESQARMSGDGGDACDTILISVADFLVLPLSERLGLAVLELRIESDTLHLVHLQEVLHGITNASRRQTLRWASEAKEQHQFGIDELIDVILRPARIHVAVWNRLYTYVYAQVQELPAGSLATDAVWRLSRHFTSAYHKGPDFMRGSGLLHAFIDVVHASSIEGAATLTAAASTFLTTNFRERVRTAYLPLIILAYYEHIELLNLAQNISVPRREQLARALDHFLTIRLRLRLPVVSEVTAHNQFYDILRQGLQIDALTRKIIEDAAEADRSLVRRARLEERAARGRSEDNHRRRERWFAPMLAMFTGMLSFLTALTALKEIREQFAGTFHDYERMPLYGAAALAALAILLETLRHISANRALGRSEESDQFDEEMQKEFATEATLAGLERTESTK